MDRLWPVRKALLFGCCPTQKTYQVFLFRLKEIYSIGGISCFCIKMDPDSRIPSQGQFDANNSSVPVSYALVMAMERHINYNKHLLKVTCFCK